MMQTQIQATNMRWGEMTLKSSQPCLVSMPNTTICNNWLSHYNCQTEMWCQIWRREILQEISNKQSTWTWWIINRQPNLDNWKRNLAKEARPTIDLILIRNQLTCIEKGKPKNNNKIRQHEKTNPSFNSPSPFPLFGPFFAQTVAIAIVITVHPDNCQWRMRPALPPPPQQPAAKAAAAAILHDLANI